MFLPFSDKSRSWEPHAEKLRSMVRLSNSAGRFDPFALAPKVGLTVCECKYTGLTESEIAFLKDGQSLRWSGGVYPARLPDGTKLCILNPLQSPRRSRITLMEEICHCYFQHSPTKLVVNSDGHLVRDYHKRQEEEAYGVGAAVLIPWARLYHLLDAGNTIEELSEMFDVTTQLVQYRIKVTGASRLYHSRQATKKRAH